MEIAIISDTHIPSRAREIPPAFVERIREADHVIHAGDFDSTGTLANINALATELTPVAGNMDRNMGLPPVATVELAGQEFVVTHGAGSRRGYERRVTSVVKEHRTTDDAIGIAGHTHEPRDTTHDGVRLLNPGSATAAAPAEFATMLTVSIESESLDVRLHSL